MRFVPVEGNSAAADILWQLMSERPVESCVSHKEMPSREDHEYFVTHHPFLYWYLIEIAEDTPLAHYVGALEVTQRNELGIHILKRWQGRGFATQALQLFLATHEPLPPVAAVRNGRWLANIACANEHSKEFFRRNGFTPLQETYVHE